MTPRDRALMGALVGAVITVIVHPLSRPLVLGTWVGSQTTATMLAPLTPVAVPAKPSSLEDAALWVHVASRKSESKLRLNPTELVSLIRLTDAAAKRDAENAFWYQSGAAFRWMKGDTEGALATWTRASKRNFWRDYQTVLLDRAQQQLAAKQVRGSWVRATLYFARSDANARLIERYARAVVAQQPLEGDLPLRARMATLTNGGLLRDGAQSVRTGMRGTAIVDLAGYPSNFVVKGSPKRMVLAQLGFSSALRKQGMLEEADRTFRQYRENDGWRALLLASPPEALAQREAVISLLIATILPGCLVGVFVGAILWGITRWIEPRLKPQARLSPLFLLPMATCLGVAGYWVTGSQVLVGMVVASSVAFMGFSPATARSQPSRDLGPLFGLTAAVLAGVIGLSIVGLLACWHQATDSLAPLLVQLDPVRDIAPDLAGVTVLCLALLCILVTVWAFARRVATGFVLLEALRRLGATLLLVSTILVIGGAPVLVTLDNQLNRTLEQLLTNEPVYYLVQ
ncbi:MAG: hypothetical protein ACOYON_04110 [Fimbriimonas sp.]